MRRRRLNRFSRRELSEPAAGGVRGRRRIVAQRKTNLGRRASCARFRDRLCLTLLLLAASPVLATEVHYYKDSEGVFHFTNVPGPNTRPFVVTKPAERQVRSAETAAYDQLIREISGSHDVEPALVKAVIRVESGFDRMAVSPRGARGLMQLMPRTARLYNAINLHDPRENIRAGVRHLRRLLDRYPKISHVLAAYNAGDAPVRRYRGVPPYPETRRFVTRVLRFREQYLREEQTAVAF